MMAWFFLPRLVSAAMTLVVLVVLTRLLGPEGFGRYNLTMVAGTVAYAGIFAWVTAAITRFHSAPEFEGRALSAALGAFWGLALALVVPVLLGFALLPGDWRLATLLGAVFCLAHALHEVALSGLRVQRAGPVYATITLLRPLIGAALAIALVSAGGGFAAALIGMTVGAALTGAVGLWQVMRVSGLTRPDPGMLRKFLAFGMPLALVSSGAMLFVMSSQAVLGALGGLGAVGLYAAAHVLSMRSIGMPMTMLARASAATVFTAHDTQGMAAAQHALDRHFSMLLLVSVPVTATLALANDTVAGVIFDESFQTGVARQLPLLAMAAFLFGLQGGFYDFAFTLARRTGVQLVILAGLLLAHAAYTMALVWLLGPIGAAWASLATAATALATYARLGTAILPIRLPRRELGVMALATLAYAPFAVAADQIRPVAPALVVLAVGMGAFCLVLWRAGHPGFQAVMRRLV